MKPVKPYHRVEARIDLSAIRENIKTIQALNPPDRKTLLVIKADAYGHGAEVIAEEMQDLADYFGVAEIDEAVELRKGGVTKPILILGYTDETEYEDLLNYDVTQAVFDVEKAESLSLLAEKMGKKASGMYSSDGVSPSKRMETTSKRDSFLICRSNMKCSAARDTFRCFAGVTASQG